MPKKNGMQIYQKSLSKHWMPQSTKQKQKKKKKNIAVAVVAAAVAAVVNDLMRSLLSNSGTHSKCMTLIYACGNGGWPKSR